MNQCLYLFLLGILVVFSSCENKEKITKEQLIADALIRKLELYKNEMKKNCNREILKTAQIKADSAFLEITKQIRQDSIYRPNKPIKPVFPELKEGKNGNDLSPIFDSIEKPKF